MPGTLKEEGLTVDYYSFGPFEVWVKAGALFHQGQRVKVQGLPFRLLVILLENAGRVLPYDELRKKLWGESAFVELDTSLWTAVARLRKVLGDDATEPRYIQAVAREGYRFIAQVNLLNEKQPQATSTGKDNSKLSAAEISQQGLSSLVSQADHGTKASFPWRSLWITLAVFSVAASGLSLYGHLRRPLLTEQDRTIFGGFTNRSGQQNLNDALSIGIRVKLEESPFLNLVSERLLQERIKNPNEAGLEPELSACIALGAQALIRGEIDSAGSGYKLILQAWNCSSGKLLVTEKVNAGSTSELLPSVDRLTFNMRKDLGESSSSAGKFNAPLAQVTTSSLSALQAYNVGQQEMNAGNPDGAMSAFKLAIELDPQFASAYSALGTMYHNDFRFAEAREYYNKAFALRERASDRERLAIASDRALENGDITRAIEDYTLWHSMYPLDQVPANGLALAYMSIGTPEKGLAAAQANMQFAPTNTISYVTLGQVYLYSGRYSSLNAMCEDHAKDEYHHPLFHATCYLGYFAQGNASGMQQELQWAQQVPERVIGLSNVPDVALYRGKVKEAKKDVAQILQISNELNAPEERTDIDSDVAPTFAAFGRMEEARAAIADAIRPEEKNPDMRVAALLVLAHAGNIPDAEAAIKKASSDTSGDLLLQNAVLPLARAIILLRKNDIQGASNMLESIHAFDFYSDMNLAPAYYRGLVDLKAKRFLDAEKEFQRVLDHRTLAPASPYLPLSQMELGHACQLSGNSVCASKAYSEAEAVWKDADSDFPPLKQLHAYEHLSH